MCTTFLAAELIRAFPEWDLIGMPRLVRLNPAVPWKTRGNGAICLRFGRGKGDGRLIGVLGEQSVRTFARGSEEPEQDEVLEVASRVVRKWAQLEDSDPGLVVSPTPPDRTLYERAVTKIIGKGEALAAIASAGGKTLELNSGRGVIGAAAAMAWKPLDRTYEVLTYRKEEAWGSPREVSEREIARLDADYPSTFNNYDREAGRPAIIPHTTCPILYGIRGDSAPELVMAMLSIIAEEAQGWLLFISNQGTDDHIVREWTALEPNSSYEVVGEVTATPRTIPGGHVLFPLRSDRGPGLEAAAYEPTKSFRDVVRRLRAGDRVRVLGELREQPRTLNIEKMEVLSLTPSRVKVANPACPSCGRRMKSAGADQGYRCRECGTREGEAVTEEEVRELRPGWYEVPVCARRHISKPLKRMGL